MPLPANDGTTLQCLAARRDAARGPAAGARLKLRATAAHMLYFLVAVVLSKLLGFGTSFATAKILEPADYGVLVTVILAVSYAAILNCGTIEALIKQYPYYTGMGRPEQARAVEESVFAATLLSALLIAATGFALPSLISPQRLGVPPAALGATVATAAISCFSSYFYYRLTAHQDFRQVGLVDTGRAIFRCIFLVGCGWLWGLEGVLWGLCGHELFTCLLAAAASTRACGRVGMNFSPRLQLEMVRIGLPITVIMWLFILQASADRMIAMWLLGKTDTGYYGLGSTIVGMLVLIPLVVSRVLYPRINQGVGQRLSAGAMETLVIVPARALALVLPLLAGILMLAAPPFYALLFPKYLPGLASAQVLLAGSFFMCLIGSGANYLIAHGRQNRTLAYAAAGLGANILASALCVRWGLGINGIALGASLSGALLATLIWKEVFARMGRPVKQQVVELLGLYSPLCLLAAAGGGIAAWVGGGLQDPAVSLAAAAAFAALYLTCVVTMPPFKNWLQQLAAFSK